MQLKLIQAEFGDCFLLNFGTDTNPRCILIDGGPTSIYDLHLRQELLSISISGGILDLVITSHIHSDHIAGVLKLFQEIYNQRSANIPEIISIRNLWHNSFNQTFGANLESRLIGILENSAYSLTSDDAINELFLSIKQGKNLNDLAEKLGISINQNFLNDLVSVENASNGIKFGNLRLVVIGPTQENLEELKKDWNNFNLLPDSILAAMTDESIPNLSSIMVVVELEGKSILFSGDGRGDHLLQGLKQKDMLDSDGKFYVDIFKIPHHGSDRNVSENFFKKIIAKKYVISTNGKDDNPDLATLTWIVESAKEQDRKIEIIVTNETHSIQKLIREYNPVIYGYKLNIMDKSSHSIEIVL